ncbi:hypothetical protein Tco_0302793 [Tanacetum coccineum]
MELLSFRNEYVLVQFWSPHVDGKQKLLTNIDQPSGVGVMDERLLLYMKNSKHNVLVVDDESQEEDIYPIARVFTRGLVQMHKPNPNGPNPQAGLGPNPSNTPHSPSGEIAQ